MSMQSLREQLKQAEAELRATPGKTKEWSDKLKVVKDLKEQLVKSGEAIKKRSV